MGDHFCIDKSAEFRHGILPLMPARQGPTELGLPAVGPGSGEKPLKQMSRKKPLKVALFNVKYSANLGDGLIAGTMETGLSRPGLSVATYDLAGRNDYGQSTLRNRSFALAVLYSLPPALRRKAVEVKLRPKLDSLAPSWRAAIAAADHVVIGGGHLFQDGDLNFPLKVGAVLALAREVGTPVSVHAVGVTDDWSAKGRELFHGLLDCDVGQISVRDAASQRSWSKHFRGTRLEQAMIAPDPVIGYAAETVPTPDHVALGVTHPRVIAYHAGSGPGLKQFFIALLRELAARGKTVTVFSNGATEDEQLIDALLEDPAIRDLAEAGEMRRAARPHRPDDLVASIAPASVVIAHRLHANILAYALGKPSLGLAWDPKLESFFELTERPEFLFGSHDLDPKSVADAVETAQRTGLDSALRKRLQSEAKESLQSLADRIVTCSASKEADQ